MDTLHCRTKPFRVNRFRDREKCMRRGTDPSMRVPFRAIALTQRRNVHTVYDTSGPFTDPDVAIDVRAGIAPVRSQLDPRTATTPSSLAKPSSVYRIGRDSMARTR